jgi:hypothetical protein
MADARMAAARDLIARLQEIETLDHIWLMAGDEQIGRLVGQAGVEVLPPAAEPFHFGRVVAGIAERHRIERLLYLGGASAPLLTTGAIRRMLDDVAGQSPPYALVNNYHSTDWGVLCGAADLWRLADDLPTDNALGWVLDTQAGWRVEGLPAAAASRCDIDTPSDVLLLHGHPDVGPHLGRFMAEQPAGWSAPVHGLRNVLRLPGSQLALIGRVPSLAWRELERRTQIWIRVYSEERGMVASGRAARREVRSLIAELIGAWGETRFVSYLAGLAQGVLWDNRVWMSVRDDWPSAADRFAADLGWVDQVADRQLQRLAAAIVDAPIPIITGGHGVVSGGVFALLESLGEVSAGSTSPG